MCSDDCPRFDTCNAAICPADDRWPTASHRNGEPVCYYLRMSGKEGAAERFADDPVFQLCLERLPAVTAKYPRIGKAIEQAARSAFPGRHLMRASGGV
jgi:hypothetical protein